jgi:hypothetical protein
MFCLLLFKIASANSALYGSYFVSLAYATLALDYHEYRLLRVEQFTNSRYGVIILLQAFILKKITF